nr:PAC2 family protein [Halorientalis salina]
MTDLEAETPTLIEGLPGHGLVASIAVEQIRKQLQLSHHGRLRSEGLPSVASFRDGHIQDTFRVYSGTDPDLLTLQSDVPIPPTAARPLSQVVLDDLAAEFERAIFLAGMPAQSESQIGEVVGVATDNEMAKRLTDANIELASGQGAIGGITGTLINECYHSGVSAAGLVVRANPYIPDPSAAKAVIENALEPLVDFDIDTSELDEQAEEIRDQLQQVAQQYRRVAQEESDTEQGPTGPSMFQ